MARIHSVLQQAIVERVVLAPDSEGDLAAVPRRKRISWQVRQADGSYSPVVATIERMNARAAAGRGFDILAMQKTSRKQRTSDSGAAQARKKKESKPAVAANTDASAPPAAPPAAPDTHVILVFDESRSMKDHLEPINDQAEAIRKRLADDLPTASVEICCFGAFLQWSEPIARADHMPKLTLGCGRGTTSLYLAMTEAANRAIAATKPTLIYLLTDGDSYADRGTPTAARVAVMNALRTCRVTFACVGPERAANFFESCGIPRECVRRWDGMDKADLQKVTAQAAKGVAQFSAARKAGQTKLDSFFVDVIAQGITIEHLKKELRDITSSLRRRKITVFAEIKQFVEVELKRAFVHGAGYYQLGARTETLKKGRRIILQPRGEELYLAGPNARKLLGLPEDRDCVIEAKNLGDFVIYIQSASENRKLLPGTTFLYDESHVAGATEPTWSKAS